MGSRVYVTGWGTPLGFCPDLRHPVIIVSAGGGGGAMRGTSAFCLVVIIDQNQSSCSVSPIAIDELAPWMHDRREISCSDA
jgi:hypothetical protein